MMAAPPALLASGESHEGVWHLEGMPHERIVATGVRFASFSIHPVTGSDFLLGNNPLLTLPSSLAASADPLPLILAPALNGRAGLPQNAVKR